VTLAGFRVFSFCRCQWRYLLINEHISLRKELEQSNIKSLSASNQIPLSVRALIQLSNERIEKAMEEVAQVPVEERWHIETLRLLMENAKLRKNLNGLSSLSLSSPLLFVFCDVYAAYLPLRVAGAIW
jgi:hypothetical protein